MSMTEIGLLKKQAKKHIDAPDKKDWWNHVSTPAKTSIKKKIKRCGRRKNH
jgi:hypothetical protein